MAITDEKYVAITTYRKNGESSSTPVWIADLGDGKVGFATPGSSLKARRIRNDARVLLQPSDARGNAKEGTEQVPGTAELVQGPEFERVLAAVKRKYGWQMSMMMTVGKLYKVFGKERLSDTGVVITLD